MPAVSLSLSCEVAACVAVLSNSFGENVINAIRRYTFVGLSHDPRVCACVCVCVCVCVFVFVDLTNVFEG